MSDNTVRGPPYIDCSVMCVHWPKWNILSSLRPAHPPHGASQQQPPTETQIQEPDEEILGSDDEEQEDPNDYCKGCRQSSIDYYKLDLILMKWRAQSEKAKKTRSTSLVHSCFFFWWNYNFVLEVQHITTADFKRNGYLYCKYRSVMSSSSVFILLSLYVSNLSIFVFNVKGKWCYSLYYFFIFAFYFWSKQKWIAQNQSLRKWQSN